LANEKQVEAVFQALCAHGLRIPAKDLTSRDRQREKATIREILEDRDPQEVIEAIRYGMPNVWPFLDGRVFNARDLRENFLKARGEAGKQARRSAIPINAQRFTFEEQDG
jgi:hypothetical protein